MKLSEFVGLLKTPEMGGCEHTYKSRKDKPIRFATSEGLVEVLSVYDDADNTYVDLGPR